MEISVLTSSLPLDLPAAIAQLASLEFTWIDVPPTATSKPACDLIEQHGLTIGCVGLEREQPEPFDLASGSASARAKAVDYFRGTLDATARLQAPIGYLTPPTRTDSEARRLWSHSLAELADHAGGIGVEIGIEHFPGRLVPTVDATLQLLADLDCEPLKLLIDVGHCLISNEPAADAIRCAGDRLGYVHFDDNDGQADLHWGLLTGRLTESDIEASLSALADVGYDRCLCLEFLPSDDSLSAVREGKAILERLHGFQGQRQSS